MFNDDDLIVPTDEDEEVKDVNTSYASQRKHTLHQLDENSSIISPTKVGLRDLLNSNNSGSR